MIQRKLFLLFLVLVGSVHLDLYSGHGKTPIKYEARTVKYIPSADRKQEVRDGILGHRKQSLSSHQIWAATVLAFVFGISFACLSNPERPLELPAATAVGALFGGFLGICMFNGKPSRFTH